MRTRTRPDSPGRRIGDREQRQVRRLFVVGVTALAALVPLILFAGFWIRSELRKGQREIESYLSVRAANLSRRVDSELEQQVTALRTLSAFPMMDRTASDMGPAVERLKALMPQWSGLAVVDAERQEVVASSPGSWPPAPVLAATGAIAAGEQATIRSERALGLDGRGIFIFVPATRAAATRLVLLARLDGLTTQDAGLNTRSGPELVFDVSDGSHRILGNAPQSPPGEAGRLKPSAPPGEDGAREAATATDGTGSSASVRSSLTGWVTTVSVDSRQLERISNRSIWATIAAGALSLVLASILVVFIAHTVMERRVSDERLSASRALGELDARLLATTKDALDEQRKASSEREVLLREIYHRVKNNLQIVQSLLRLGSRDLSPDQREPFESAVRRIGAMARVHTLLYNSPDLASIDFKDYLGELLKELSEGFGAEERSIVATLRADTMRVPLDTAVPLAFIAVEILTNAYRHAFPDGRPGKISVHIGRDEPFGTLRIEDDGIGVGKDAAGKRRLGLTIVRKLVQQIGGALEEPESGQSGFLVRFPLGPDNALQGASPAVA